MKKLVAILTLPLLASSLSSCSPDDGKWKEKYGNPVLFMENVIEMNNPQHYGSCYYLYENSRRNLDEEYIIATEIKDAGPFSEAKKKEVRPKRYITYQAYWTPATSGPNYCNLVLYEDGFIEIVHKKSLGPYGYLYFEMDAVKAKYVVDSAFTLTESMV